MDNIEAKRILRENKIDTAMNDERSYSEIVRAMVKQGLLDIELDDEDSVPREKGQEEGAVIDQKRTVHGWQRYGHSVVSKLSISNSKRTVGNGLGRVRLNRS